MPAPSPCTRPPPMPLRRAATWSARWRRCGRACSGVPELGVHDNFFDLGGTLAAAVPRVQPRCARSAPRAAAGGPVPLHHGRVAGRAPGRRDAAGRRACPEPRARGGAPGARRPVRGASVSQGSTPQPEQRTRSSGHEDAIAIVGMSRPLSRRATRPAAFWANLRGGVRIDLLLLRRGAARRPGYPDAMLRDPALRAGRAARWPAPSRSTRRSSASRPREAEVIDPQHRLFLECAWEALEDAGYDPARFPGADRRVRRRAGSTPTCRSVLARPRPGRGGGPLPARRLGNDKDFLTTRARRTS